MWRKGPEWPHALPPSPPAGEPKVTLSERCRGLVRIDDVNVCSDGKTFEHAQIACMEQNCGNALFVDVVPADPGTDNFHIRCESYHDLLGKCSRLRGKCTEGLMYIHCAGKCAYVCPSKQKRINVLENVGK